MPGGLHAARIAAAERCVLQSSAAQPAYSSGISALDVQSISSGEHHTLVLAADGVVYSCGRPRTGAWAGRTPP